MGETHMSDVRPTDIAKEQADGAARTANQALLAELGKGNHTSHEALMADAIQHLCVAVSYVATGLRATYMLLEKIERQQRTGRP